MKSYLQQRKQTNIYYRVYINNFYKSTKNIYIYMYIYAYICMKKSCRLLIYQNLFDFFGNLEKTSENKYQSIYKIFLN